eukprot:3047552-Pyramimonas_sp.AAC.1
MGDVRPPAKMASASGSPQQRTAVRVEGAMWAGVPPPRHRGKNGVLFSRQVPESRKAIVGRGGAKPLRIMPLRAEENGAPRRRLHRPAHQRQPDAEWRLVTFNTQGWD